MVAGVDTYVLMAVYSFLSTDLELDLSSSPASAMEIDQQAWDAADMVLSNGNLMKLILENVSFQDLCRVASVCRVWHEISNSDDFWTEVSFQHKRVNRSQVRSCFHFSTHARSLQAVQQRATTQSAHSLYHITLA
jgi:hypothetical protein